MLGHPVYFFAYPFGDFNDEVVQAVRAAGFTMAYTTAGGTTESTASPLTMPRLHVGRSEDPSGLVSIARRRLTLELAFTDGRVDSGPGGMLAQAMRDEIAVIYDGLGPRRRHHAQGRAGRAEPPGGAFLVGWIDGEPVCCGGVKRLDDAHLRDQEDVRGPGRPRYRRRPAAAARARGQGPRARLRDRPARHRPSAGQRPGPVRVRGLRAIEDFNGNPVAVFWGEKPLTE